MTWFLMRDTVTSSVDENNPSVLEPQCLADVGVGTPAPAATLARFRILLERDHVLWMHCAGQDGIGMAVSDAVHMERERVIHRTASGTGRITSARWLRKTFQVSTEKKNEPAWPHPVPHELSALNSRVTGS